MLPVADELIGRGGQCPLLAQSGHYLTEFQCLLLGVKRTSTSRCEMFRIEIGVSMLPSRTLHSPQNTDARWELAPPKPPLMKVLFRSHFSSDKPSACRAAR